MEKEDKISDEQLYDLITGNEVSWQSIIYELIRTEQLDPWDIDIVVLADKYLIYVKSLEEANFFISSKVLLACAILLRIKSEILNDVFLQQLDESFYGKKEEVKKIIEKININEDELPLLIPKTPLPRFKKVTLQELMVALNKAIETETRRIKKDIRSKNASKKISSLIFDLNKKIPLKDRINQIVQELEKHFKELKKEEVCFSELAKTKDEKVAFFLPVLHLDNEEKIFIKQYSHFEDFFIRLEKFKEQEKELLNEEGIN